MCGVGCMCRLATVRPLVLLSGWKPRQPARAPSSKWGPDHRSDPSKPCRALPKQAELRFSERRRLYTPCLVRSVPCRRLSAKHPRRPGPSRQPPRSPHYGANYTIWSFSCQRGFEHRSRGAFRMVFQRFQGSSRMFSPVDRGLFDNFRDFKGPFLRFFRDFSRLF